MNASCVRDALGLILGGLAIRGSFAEAVSLSMLFGNLRRVGRVFPRELAVDILLRLKIWGVAFVQGDESRAEDCSVLLVRGKKARFPFRDAAENFVLGALALHFSPRVQVSELRQAAERLWPEAEVREVLYPVVCDLREKGVIKSYERTSDVDQWYVWLVTDDNL